MVPADRRGKLIMGLLIVSVLIFGCAGGQSGEKSPSETPAKTATPTPEKAATAEKTPESTPTPEETAQEEKLHDFGECSKCHDAPSVSDMASGIHRSAFEKQTDIHKDLCTNCHDVKTFCGQCHEVPAFYK